MASQKHSKFKQNLTQLTNLNIQVKFQTSSKSSKTTKQAKLRKQLCNYQPIRQNLQQKASNQVKITQLSQN